MQQGFDFCLVLSAFCYGGGSFIPVLVSKAIDQTPPSLPFPRGDAAVGGVAMCSADSENWFYSHVAAWAITIFLS